MGNFVPFLEATQKGAESMGDFVTSLGTVITSAKLWTEVGPIAGVVGVLVLFKLGYNVLKKNVNNATKATGRAMK